MIKLMVTYKYASCYPISSMMIQCQLAALSNCCATEIAFARPSVIAAPDIPADFSMLIPVHNYQRHWQFQAPTGELINHPIYILPVLLAQYEDLETVLAHLINPVLKTSASSVVQRTALTMSQSAQTDITDSSICRRCMNAGNRADRLAHSDRFNCHPLASEEPSTSTIPEETSTSEEPSTSTASNTNSMDESFCISDTVLNLPSLKLNRPLPQTHYQGVCAQCHSPAYIHCCLLCRLVFYCSARCQHLHWDRHRKFCQKIKFTQGRADQ